MGVYRVELDDGQAFDVDADSPDLAQQAVLSQFQSAPKQPEAPHQAGAIERATEGAIAGAVPGYSSYQAIKSGAPGSDIASAVSGDIANLAMMGLAGPSKLASATATGAGMGAAAGALQPAIKAAGDVGRGIVETILPLNKIPPSQSVALNMLREAPGAIGETAGELAPQFLAMLLGGKMLKGAAKGPAPIPAAAEALVAEGGKPTAAMQATGGISKGLLGGLEVSARTNPLLEGKFKAIDEANAQAGLRAAQKSFGTDVNEPGLMSRAGRELGQSLENLAGQRREAYRAGLGDIEGSLAAVDDPVRAIETAKKIGPNMAAALDNAAQGQLPSVKALFSDLRTKLASGQLTPGDIELELQDLRLKFDNQFAALREKAPGSLNAADMGFSNMVNAVKDAYYSELDKVQPGIGSKLREIKGDYAQASEGMAPLARAMSVKGGTAPELSVRNLMSQGTDAIAALKEQMSPADWANTRQQIAAEIINRARGKEGISAQKLKTMLETNPQIRELLPIVFDDGTELGNLRNLVSMMETAKQNELGVVNPSGTFTQGARLGQIGAALAPSAWPALAAKTAADVAYTYGAPAAQGAMRTAQTAAAPIAQAVLAGIPRNRAIAMAALNTNRATQAEGRPTLFQALKGY